MKKTILSAAVATVIATASMSAMALSEAQSDCRAAGHTVNLKTLNATEMSPYQECVASHATSKKSGIVGHHAYIKVADKVVSVPLTELQKQGSLAAAKEFFEEEVKKQVAADIEFKFEEVSRATEVFKEIQRAQPELNIEVVKTLVKAQFPDVVFFETIVERIVEVEVVKNVYVEVPVVETVEVIRYVDREVQVEKVVTETVEKEVQVIVEVPITTTVEVADPEAYNKGFADGVASVNAEDGIGQKEVDASYEAGRQAGVASVTFHQASFDAGVASVSGDYTDGYNAAVLQKTAEIEDLNTQLTTAKEQLATEKEYTASADATIFERETTIKELELKVVDLEGQLATAKAAQATALNALSDAEVKLTLRNTTIETLKTTVSDLQTDLEAKKVELATATTSLTAKDGTITELKSEIADLKVDLAAAKASLSAVNNTKYASESAAYQAGVDSVTPEDGITQATVDAAVNAVDLTVDNAQAIAYALAEARNTALSNGYTIPSVTVSIPDDAAKNSLIEQLNDLTEEDLQALGKYATSGKVNYSGTVTSAPGGIYSISDLFWGGYGNWNVFVPTGDVYALGYVNITSPNDISHSFYYATGTINFTNIQQSLTLTTAAVAMMVAEAAFDAGYSEGFGIGFGVGYLTGYEDGYADGYQDGYTDGYGQGFTDGVNSVQ